MSEVKRGHRRHGRLIAGTAAFLAPAALAAACASIPGSGTGSTAGPSTEASPSAAASSQSPATSPSCMFRKLSLGEMRSVVDAGTNASSTFAIEDIDSAGLMDADGGPRYVKLIEFTGSAALTPAETKDQNLIVTQETTEEFAGALGIPPENLDFKGEAYLQSGNGGVHTPEAAGTVILIWSHAASNICNETALPHGQS